MQPEVRYARTTPVSKAEQSDAKRVWGSLLTLGDAHRFLGAQPSIGILGEASQLQDLRTCQHVTTTRLRKLLAHTMLLQCEFAGLKPSLSSGMQRACTTPRFMGGRQRGLVLTGRTRAPQRLLTPWHTDPYRGKLPPSNLDSRLGSENLEDSVQDSEPSKSRTATSGANSQSRWGSGLLQSSLFSCKAAEEEGTSLGQSGNLGYASGTAVVERYV